MSNKQNIDTEIYVTKLMKELGIPASIKGFHYIRRGICLVLENIKFANFATKLYKTIADEYNKNGSMESPVSPSQVERDIRHAITVSWSRGNIDLIHDLFGYTVKDEKGKPTNSEFIAIVADKVRQELRWNDKPNTKLEVTNTYVLPKGKYELYKDHGHFCVMITRASSSKRDSYKFKTREDALVFILKEYEVRP